MRHYFDLIDERELSKNYLFIRIKKFNKQGPSFRHKPFLYICNLFFKIFGGNELILLLMKDLFDFFSIYKVIKVCKLSLMSINRIINFDSLLIQIHK